MNLLLLRREDDRQQICLKLERNQKKGNKKMGKKIKKDKVSKKEIVQIKKVYTEIFKIDDKENHSKVHWLKGKIKKERYLNLQLHL